MKTKKTILSDDPDFSKLVKGRKKYICEWCGKDIYKGDHHIYYNGKTYSGGLWERHRFHSECYEYLGKDERNAKFGFRKRKNIRADQKCIKIKKYLCEFWEAVSIPGSRRTAPFKREVEIAAGSLFLAREACEEEFSILEFIDVKQVMSKSKQDSQLNTLINVSRSRDIKKRLKAVNPS